MLKSWTAIPAGVMLAACLFGGVASAEECEIKLGATGPMSGGAASWGLSLKSATEFEAAVVNNAGGLQMGDKKCKIRVIPYDAGMTAAGGAAAANYFASQGVHVVVGPIGSVETLGFKPVAARNGITNTVPSYYAKAIGPDFPLVFHFEQNPVAWGPALMDAAVKRFHFKSVMILGPNDQGGTDSGAALAKLYSEHGVKSTEEYYQRGTTNFAPLATRIMNTHPDVVEIAATPPSDVTPIVRSLMEAGYQGMFAGMAGVGAEKVIEGAGGVEKIKGYYWLEEAPTEGEAADRMRADFKRVMNYDPPTFGQFYATDTGVQLMINGIRLAGTDQDGEKVAEAIRKSTPESRYFGKGGWRGRAQFGINQELAFPVGMGVIENGKRIGVVAVPLPTED
jgi:branched-chain amino acid transport system substrate-binding protein